MFISVKSLTELLNQDFIYYVEGMKSKEEHSKEEFEKWELYITATINKRVAKLEKISSNRKLIARYKEKAKSLFEEV